MDKSIRVRIMGREYSLLVREDDEELTREIATYIDAKMVAFRDTHPNQSELTAAVITAMAVAEELYTTWEEQDGFRGKLDAEVADLADRLDAALGEETPPEAGADEPEVVDEEILDSRSPGP